MEPLSRQATRWMDRQMAKHETVLIMADAKKAARRALLDRQTRREKSGFYDGRSVAMALSPSRSRVTKRKVKKGNAFARILRTFVEDGREIQIHATKGRRSFRAAA